MNKLPSVMCSNPTALGISDCCPTCGGVGRHRTIPTYGTDDRNEPRDPDLVAFTKEQLDELRSPNNVGELVSKWAPVEIIPYPDRWTREALAENQFVHIRVGKPHLRLHVKLGNFTKEPMWWVREFCRTPNGSESKYYECAEAIGMARSRFKIHGHV
jgi:hypothetical protein